MNRYTCSLDVISKYMPWLIVAGLASSVAIRMPDIHHGLSTFGSVFLLILMGVILSLYLLMPRAIEVTDSAITIERKIGDVIIPISDIRSLQKVDDMRFSFRLFGNGGVFGYTGYFWKRGIGIMRWHCTQRRNYVLITKTSGRKIVITPDERDAFIVDVEARSPLLVIA